MVATRGLLRAVATLSVAVAIALGVLVGFSPASSAATSVVGLAGGPNSPTVAADGVVTVSALITNQSSAALAGGTLALASSDEPLLDEASLNTWLAAKGNDGFDLATVSVPAIAPKATIASTISIPANRLPSPEVWGVRGLLLTYEQGKNAPVTLRTTVVLLAVNSPAPVQLATVLPLVGPPSALGLMTQAELTKTTGTGGYLASLLNMAKTAPVTLAVDPRITTSILALGASAPASATAWLKGLNASTKSGFWLTYSDSDISGQIQAGAKTPIQPNISDVANIPEPFTGTTWDGLNWPGWAPTLSGVAWPLANSVSAAVPPALTQSGYTRAVLSSGNLTGGTPSSSAGRLAGLPVAVVNDTASGCAQQLAVADSVPARAYTSACLAAHIAVAASTQPAGSAVVIGLPRSGVSLNSASFSNALSTLATLPFAVSTTLDGVFAGSSAPVSLAPKSESAARLTSLKAALANQAKIVSFSPVAAEPSLIINPGQRRLAAITSSVWVGQTLWTGGLAENSTLTAEVLNGVSIVTSSPINMVSGQARIPVVIRNDLPSAVSVLVHSVPSNARIAVEGNIPLTVEANAQGRAYIPVTARVGSGSVDLEVSLTDQAGNRVGSIANLPVNVRADWETFGLFGLAVVFFGLIIAGVIRTVRRRPRKVRQNE
jgi:hypothetical protein